MATNKQGVHIMVKLPSGTEVHEFILPLGYTIDQVKSAIFKKIPELSEQEREEYQLALHDKKKEKDEVLSVEFNKLSNLPQVKEAQEVQQPIEVSLHSKSFKKGTAVPPPRKTITDLLLTRPSLSKYVSTSGSTSSGKSTTASPSTSPSASPSSSSSAVSPSLGLSVSAPVSLPVPATTGQDTSTTSTSTSTSSASTSTSTSSANSAGPATSTSTSTSPSTSTLAPPNPGLAPGKSKSARYTEKDALKKRLEAAEAEQARLKKKLEIINALAKIALSANHLSFLGGMGNLAGKALVSSAPNSPGASEKQAHPSSSPSLPHQETENEKRLTKALEEILRTVEATDEAPILNKKKDTLPRARSWTDVQEKVESKQQPSLGGKGSAILTNTSNSSSSSSASASASGNNGNGPEGVSSPSMPPRKQLTPEERIELLQNEFLVTEEHYVKYLQILHDVFLVPIESSGVLTPEQVDILFSRVRTQLLQIHKSLLAALQQRTPETSFSDCLLNFVPYLKLYTDYVNNHPQATQLLFEMTANNKKFATLIKSIEAQPECEVQDLSSFLIKPIQRLPRYELLLRDMVKYSTDQQEHLKLSKLFETVKKINAYINESKRRRDNSSKVFEIQSNLIQGTTKFTLYEQQRMYVREDTLQVRKVKKGNKLKKHHVFLFSDILLDTVRTKEGKFKLRQVFKLREISLQKYEGEPDTVALFMINEGEEDNAVHVKATPGVDIDRWMQDVLQCMAALKNDSITIPDRLVQITPVGTPN